LSFLSFSSLRQKRKKLFSIISKKSVNSKITIFPHLYAVLRVHKPKTMNVAKELKSGLFYFES